MLDNKRAGVMLKRSLFSYIFEVLWRSALLTALLALTDYRISREDFEWQSVWINFVVIAIFFSILTFFGLLLAAGRYRKRAEDTDDN